MLFNVKTVSNVIIKFNIIHRIHRMTGAKKGSKLYSMKDKSKDKNASLPLQNT